MRYTVAMKALQPLRWWADQILWSLQFIGQEIGKGLISLRSSRFRHVIYGLLLTNAVSVGLFMLRLIGADNFRYWFMLWNLLLAWVAPLIAWWLVRRLRKTKWRTWQNILLTIIWLGFLPNSFYMVSDLIHVHQTGEISIYFDAVLFASFIFNGFIAGYLGTFLLHREALRRLAPLRAHALVVAVFALCGYAIYLGRVLRWNTWDAILQPAALLFDVSDNILNPLGHPQAFVVTLSFTLLISAFYFLAHEFVRVLRSNRG